MLIIFSGYLLNLYLGVDKFGVIAGSERKVPIKVPIKVVGSEKGSDKIFTLPIKFILWGKLKLTPLTCTCMGIPEGRVRSNGWFPWVK
jgi:hypothetical protein